MGKSGNRFVWYELATTDVETAKTFYAGVVGWATGDTPMPGAVYSQFTAGDIPVAGLMKLAAGGRREGPPPQWIGFVGVDDVDAVVGRARELGGTVHVPPTDVPNVTRFSVIADPQMAPLAVVKGPARGQERPIQPAAPGHVGWHELLATDLEKTFTFYSQLFGWQKAEGDASSTGNYQQFSAGTETIGAMFTRSEVSTLSLWLFYFNVGDIEAAAKRVEARGGKVLYGPTTVQSGARVAHCRDPEGAMFGLIDRRVRIAVGCYTPRAGRPS